MPTWPAVPPAAGTSLTFTTAGRLRRMRAVDADQWVILEPDLSVGITRAFAGGFVVETRRLDGGSERILVDPWSAVADAI